GQRGRDPRAGAGRARLPPRDRRRSGSGADRLRPPSGGLRRPAHGPDAGRGDRRGPDGADRRRRAPCVDELGGAAGAGPPAPRRDRRGGGLVRAELASRRETAVDPAQALIGFGHRLVDFAVQPTVPMLDEATGAVPTVLIGGDAHHAWMNSAALRALGLPPRDGIVAEEDWFVLAPRLPELPGIADAVATGSAM